MTTVITVKTTAGPIKLPAKKFALEVGGKRLWFGLHRAVGNPSAQEVTISHWKTGMEVVTLPEWVFDATPPGGEVETAKRHLAAFFNARGTERCRKIIEKEMENAK